MNFTLVGRVTDTNGRALANAVLRFISDLATLGATPQAVVAAQPTINWTRELQLHQL